MTTFGRLRDLDDDALRAAYAPPRLPWLRLNFVATVDGAAEGGDGTSGSINNAADNRVFHLLRELADVVVVGAGTVRAEGYRPNAKPLVVVTRSGELPPTLLEGDTSRLHLATGALRRGWSGRGRCSATGCSCSARRRPTRSRSGRPSRTPASDSILCEGGPHLAADLLAAGLVDELCSTVVPTLVGGSHARIAEGAPVDVPLDLHSLLEADGTLLARWFVRPLPG